MWKGEKHKFVKITVEMFVDEIAAYGGKFKYISVIFGMATPSHKTPMQACI